MVQDPEVVKISRRAEQGWIDLQFAYAGTGETVKVNGEVGSKVIVGKVWPAQFSEIEHVWEEYGQSEYGVELWNSYVLFLALHAYAGRGVGEGTLEEVAKYANDKLTKKDANLLANLRNLMATAQIRLLVDGAPQEFSLV